jgi:hypothetical protein
VSGGEPAVDFGGPDAIYLISGTLLVAQAATQVLTGRGAVVRTGAAVDPQERQQPAHSR